MDEGVVSLHYFGSLSKGPILKFSMCCRERKPKEVTLLFRWLIASTKEGRYVDEALNEGERLREDHSTLLTRR